MRKIIFNIVIVIVVFSCNSKSNSNYQKIKDIDNVKKGKVLFIGKADDLEAFNHINVMNWSSASLNHTNSITDKKVIGDSIVMEIDSIIEPQQLLLTSWSKDSNYRAEFIGKPNDTIIFEIKNKRLRIKGEKADEHNFYSSLRDSTPRYIHNPYKGSIMEYKSRVDSIYRKQVDFFNKYVKRHNITSKSFIDFVESSLKYSHMYQLLTPNTEKRGDSVYLSGPDEFFTIIQKEYGSKERLFDLKDYIGDVTIDDFKDESHLNRLSFKSALTVLIRNYFETSDHPSYSKEKFLAEKAIIEYNFDEKIQEYAIASLITVYHDRGLGHSKQSVSFLKNEIHQYGKQYPDSEYTKEMEDILLDLNSFELKLPESALNTKLLSKYGDTLTLGEIFNRSNKRIRVVNFWASWCPPCISEIQKTKDFRDKLSVENNVEWIYLSIDEDEKKWLEKSKELESYLNVRNQYLVMNGSKSPLGRDLKIHWIPRYIILNKQNQIVLNNAPHPSDNVAFKKIIDSIK
ncbi:TlpA family protein disulfide reductase [Winogradskyella immobilis]|uniref:Thioredoxin family protein n=1 Tax=Winogradskyella immobilis TaxID=2816852 RepID=A0ABS8EJN0_9FLAO|nr:thioredoxin family protein [Winogradskyella immobilis]MCC1483413.1 thioredoxin family protein [Winogradskyella immobilis]MCG0015507.1 thioredoxin family protein [Winogradskyella immobilis]